MGGLKGGVTFDERMRGLHRPGVRLTLKTKSEVAALKHVHDISAISYAELETPGVVASLVEGRSIPPEILTARLVGRMGGANPPQWHDGSDGARMAGVVVSRVKQAIHLPKFGAVVTSTGDVLGSSIAEALYLTPSLSALPGVKIRRGEPVMTLMRGVPVLDRAAVFMAWGGRFNYGHFLIDCLSALAALDEAGLLGDWTPIAPRLSDWQRDCLRLMLGEQHAARIREISAPAVHVDDLVFASPMDHFLQAPNRPLNRVRERMLSAIDEPATGLPRIYINRRDDKKRPLVNEKELEAALLERGFVSIAPETLALSKQIALFRDADIIVAPTGAALANVLFCKPGAKIFEIQPTNFVGIWVRGIAHFVGAHWHGMFAPSPLFEKEVRIEGAPKAGLKFRWQVSVTDVLAWVDGGLGLPEAPALDPAWLHEITH